MKLRKMTTESKKKKYEKISLKAEKFSKKLFAFAEIT